MAKEDIKRSCPYCKEDIKPDATKCKYCRSKLSPTKPPHDGTCPYCKEEIHKEAIKCKHCHSNLVSGSHSCCGNNDKTSTELAQALLRLGIGTSPPATGGELECAFAYLDCMEKGIFSPTFCEAFQTACRIHSRVGTVVK